MSWAAQLTEGCKASSGPPQSLCYPEQAGMWNARPLKSKFLPEPRWHSSFHHLLGKAALVTTQNCCSNWD